MSGVTITPEVFARLVGRHEERGTLLFEVAHEFLEWSADWSDPVQYRFVKREGGLVEMQIHRIEPPGKSA